MHFCVASPVSCYREFQWASTRPANVWLRIHMHPEHTCTPKHTHMHTYSNTLQLSRHSRITSELVPAHLLDFASCVAFAGYDAHSLSWRLLCIVVLSFVQAYCAAKLPLGSIYQVTSI
jgi:hypothetical protein